jgi:MATE family multidrug resistance protein
MLANLTTPLLGVVATACIGRLGDPALLGGVAIASVVFDCLFWLFGFLRMGTVAFTAQALGARDHIEIRATLFRAIIVAASIGLLLIAVSKPLGDAILSLMGGSEPVTAAAREYFAIRLWSAPMALGNYALLGWFVGQARAKTALTLQILINVANIAMTAWLVLVLNKGVAGAAIAAVLAETAGFVVGAALAWRLLGSVFDISTDRLFDRERLLHMFSVNRDILIRTAALIAAFLFFTSQGARAGDTVLAANAVLNNFLLISAFFLDGIANAAEQICGRTYGKRDREGFLIATRLVMLWGFVFALAVSAAYFLFGSGLIALMTSYPDIQHTANAYLVFVILAPIVGFFAFAYDGIFIGATWARDMRNLMLLSLVIFLAAWVLLRPFGNAGLWAALLVHYVARGGLQALRYPALLRASFGDGALSPANLNQAKAPQ